jgi:hypothetical protein
VLSGEATNINFIVFGLTRLGLEPTIYHTRGKHANHYTTDAVATSEIQCKLYIYIKWPICLTEDKDFLVMIHYCLFLFFPDLKYFNDYHFQSNKKAELVNDQQKYKNHNPE